MEEKKEDLKFEEAFELLRREAEIISSDSVSLEEAMESYKKGKEYFEICSRYSFIICRYGHICLVNT